MTRSVADYLENMLAAVKRARRHVGGMDLTAFVGNEMAVDAAVRTLEIVGEAAK